MARLKSSGKIPSARQRLTTVVIGRISELIQDFKRRVGMKSKEQVASEEERKKKDYGVATEIHVFCLYELLLGYGVWAKITGADHVEMILRGYCCNLLRVLVIHTQDA